MDYDKILQHIGSFGKFQKILIFLLTVPVVFNAPTTYMLNFILGNQEYRCRVPHLDDNVFSTTIFSLANKTINITAGECYRTENETKTPCDDWVFDETVYKSTLVSKFNLVCKDKLMRSHVLLSYFIGSLFGAFTYGFMCDTLGRKPSLFVAICLLVFPNVITPWMPNIFLVLVCQFFNATGSIYAYYVPLLIVTELVGPDRRVLVSFIIYFSYCLGEYLLLVLANFIRDWESLILSISAPITICFFTLFFTTESPRWLLVKGRGKEAMAIFQKTAKYNGTCIDFKADDITVKDKSISLFRNMKEMVKSRTMMKRFMILIFNWFCISMIYYGISMNVGDLGGNVYINYALSTTVETAAIVLCIFVDYFPRKKLYCASMIVGGVACLCTIFTSLFAAKSLHWITIGLAMVGKLGISIAFFVIIIITSEIFPTVIRATVFGLCNAGARVGSISSSYIGKLGILIDTDVGVALPLIVFGAFGTTAGIVALFLPETRRIKLPETLDDAIVIKSKSRTLLVPRMTSEEEAVL